MQISPSFDHSELRQMLPKSPYEPCNGFIVLETHHHRVLVGLTQLLHRGHT
jgi:hypothetical protein